MSNYETIGNLNTTYYMDSSSREDFSTLFISSALNCPYRRPTEKDIVFCEEPDYNSPWPECQKKKMKPNECNMAVCCNSINMNKMNQCSL